MTVEHREKDIKKGCLTYLKVLENQEKILWFDRLNSGNYYMPASGGYRGRLIQGCRPGTPDIYAILNDGHVVWIECKSTTGKMSEDQKKFAAKVISVHHTHYVIRSVDQLIELMDELL